MAEQSHKRGSAMRAIMMILCVLALSGCVAGKQEYSSYLAAMQARDQQQAVEKQQQALAWAEIGKACSSDPACVRDVAREFTLAAAFDAVSKAGGGGQGRIEQFHVQAHPATAAVTGIAGVVLPQAIQGVVQIRASDNARDVSVSANQLQAATAQGAYNLGAAAVAANAGAFSDIASILPGLQPSQNYSAGGNLSLGDMHNGDNVGRDNLGDGSQVGHNTGAINTGTQNDRGVIGSGQIGNGRQNAPGPFVGPICSGEDCQRPNPLPTPEPEG